MGGQAKIDGPDLTVGVKVDEVPDGGSLLGHAGDQPVLLARRGDALFAVGATCTHYGGPLAEGLIVGDTVRCPWHQACFDLRTGAPSAPAFNPIPCYRVERRGDKVVVSEPITPAPAPPRTSPERVVIVGAGPAGALAAETLRRLGHTGSITLLGEESTPPVDRPNLSKDYLAGNAPEEWMTLRSAEDYAAREIDLRTGTRVTAIDRSARTLSLDGGATLGWDALVLATGAEPVRLEIPGAERIRYLRTLADSRSIIAEAKPGRRAVVIGASFIGLEVAASLRTRGLEVLVVGREERPLERVLGRELAELVRSVHEQHGVRFALGRSPRAVEPGAVVLDDDSRHEADLVVAGVGVRPRTDLAERAGLKIDHGVLVDGELRAAPDVYAIGDCARWPDPITGERVRIEHWVVAERHGEAVARTLLGLPPASRRAPFFWSAHFDLTINYVGHAPSWDRVVVDGDVGGRDCAVHYHRGERLLAVATVGRDRYALEVAARLEG